MIACAQKSKLGCHLKKKHIELSNLSCKQLFSVLYVNVLEYDVMNFSVFLPSSVQENVHFACVKNDFRLNFFSNS